MAGCFCVLTIGQGKSRLDFPGASALETRNCLSRRRSNILGLQLGHLAPRHHSRKTRDWPQLRVRVGIQPRRRLGTKSLEIELAGHRALHQGYMSVQYAQALLPSGLPGSFIRYLALLRSRIPRWLYKRFASSVPGCRLVVAAMQGLHGSKDPSSRKWHGTKLSSTSAYVVMVWLGMRHRPSKHDFRERFRVPIPSLPGASLDTHSPRPVVRDKQPRGARRHYQRASHVAEI